MIISLRYCSECLKDLCPNFEMQPGKFAFFVPTKDYMMRDYFVYLQIEKDVLRQIFMNASHGEIVNLCDIGTVLHIEQGLFPTSGRAKEIESFFNHPQHHIANTHYHSDMPKFEMVG